MKKRVFIVTGHCDSNEKEFVTLSLLEEIKSKYVDDDLVYGSHLKISEKIQDIVDYAFYIKENPIENRDIITDITKGYALNFYDIPNNGDVIKFLIPNHGYAHHMLISGTMRCLVHDYEYYHFCNYDIEPKLFFDSFNYREKFCDSYDGFFYNFNYNQNWINTEFFTIRKNIVDVISQIKEYEEYTSKISLEEIYTDLLKPRFKIYTEDHDIKEGTFGKIDFKSSKSNIVKSLNPHFPEFDIVAVKYQDMDKIIIHHRAKNDIDVIFHRKNGDEKINVQSPGGGWHMLSVIEPCIVSVFRDGILYFKFDLNDRNNYGEFV